MESVNLYHFDIKLENILIQKGTGKIYFIDFENTLTLLNK